MKKKIEKLSSCRFNMGIGGIAILLVLLLGAFTLTYAQQPQIPTLQVCNPTKVSGKAMVTITRRSDAVHTGSFTVYIDPKNPLSCNPMGTGYPGGRIVIHNISMSDSTIQGAIEATNIEQVTTTGKHTPTVYVNGRCIVKGEMGRKIRGCRFWMMIADNRSIKQTKGTPDVISFLVFDRGGNRVAYGTGPVVKGDITVAPTSY